MPPLLQDLDDDSFGQLEPIFSMDASEDNAGEHNESQRLLQSDRAIGVQVGEEEMAFSIDGILD